MWKSVDVNATGCAYRDYDLFNRPFHTHAKGAPQDFTHSGAVAFRLKPSQLCVPAQQQHNLANGKSRIQVCSPKRSLRARLRLRFSFRSVKRVSQIADGARYVM